MEEMGDNSLDKAETDCIDGVEKLEDVEVDFRRDGEKGDSFFAERLPCFFEYCSFMRQDPLFSFTVVRHRGVVEEFVSVVG